MLAVWLLAALLVGATVAAAGDKVVDPYAQPETLKETPVDLPLGNGKPPLVYRPLAFADLYTELCIAAAFALYLVLFLQGSRKNKELARTWLRSSLGIWSLQFAQVGDGQGHKLIRDGPRDYILYATGRKYVAHVFGFLQLVARHDPLQMLMNLVMRRTPVDTLKVQVTLQPGAIDPCVLALLLKSKTESVAENRWDLEKFAKPCSVPGMPKDVYSAFADAPEMLDHVWSNQRLRAILLESGSPVEQILLSDLPSLKPTELGDLENVPQVLIVVYRLPDLSKPQQEIQESLTRLTVFLVDLIDTLGDHGRLSADGLAKTKKFRLAAQEGILKAKEEDIKEALQRKKIQEKKAREEAVTLLSPEEQRKWAEKEKRRDAKKAQKKMMKKGKSVRA